MKVGQPKAGLGDVEQNLAWDLKLKCFNIVSTESSKPFRVASRGWDIVELEKNLPIAGESHL